MTDKVDKNGENLVDDNHVTSARKARPSFRKMFSTRSTDVTDSDDVKTEPVSSWVKLVATFLVNVLIATADTVFGILYDHFTEQYDAPRAAVGWVLSVFALAGSLSGLILSPFVVMYGCRPVALTALLLMSVGTCLSAIAPNLASLLVFYGVFGGCGWGGIYLVTSTIIQQTFSCHRGLATGIAALGFTTGTILSPILVEYLVRQYGLTGGLLLLGGVYAQGLVFSMVLKSPKRLIQKKRRHNSSKQNDCAELEKLKIDGDLKSDKELEAKQGDKEESAAKQSFVLLLKNMLDFTVFRKVTFVLSILYYLSFWMGRYIILSQGVGAALHHGIPEKDAAYLLTIMGLSNLVIRLLSAFLLNCSWMNPILYTCLATLFMLGAGTLMTFAQEYPMFVGAMVCLGFSEGVGVTVMPMVLVHILGVTRFARAWSILWVGLLPGTMTAGPLSGWLVDFTKSYAPAFILAGVLGGAASLISIIIEIIIKLGKKKKVPTATLR